MASAHILAVTNPRAAGERFLLSNNAELRPFIPDLGYAKRTSNEKARRLLGWMPRDPHEAIVAAAKSMVGKGLLKA